jgi:hypothetical protein
MMVEKEPKMTAFDEFKARVESLQKQGEVTEEDFFTMAQQAILSYREEPKRREEIARTMTSLWLNDKDIEEGSLLDQIGGEFADLELPDAHVDIKGFGSVEEKWEALANKIQSAIEKREK